jgi:histidyl-tRNA synthetase
VGTDSLLCEAEIIGMIRQVFAKLSLTHYSIKINNRKILTGIAEAIGADGKEGPLCVAIDKLDKIGWEKVQEELQQRGFENDSLARLEPIVNLKEGINDRMEVLNGFLKNSPPGLQGLQELKEVFREIAEERGEINRRRLGRWIARHQGQVVNGRRLEKVSTKNSAEKWQVVQVK